MVDLTSALRSAIDVKDRKFLLKSYPDSFLGHDAVSWMLQTLPIRDREEAVNLGNKLLEKGYIKSVDSKGFKDNDSLFIFTKHISGFKIENENNNIKEEKNVSLDDFDILQTVGKGGFAMVVKVSKKDNKKIYAMKIMHKTKISSPRQLECLIAEKNIMLNDNPFLVHLHYSFQTEEKLFFVMDYIPGGDMAYHLNQKGRFMEKEVRFFIAEIVLGLEHLHSCGVVYRDLKLENILIDKEGHICLTDFGLSKELDSISGTTKTICGTPTYLAPEIILGKQYGNAVDWWSLGVVTYELFTGINPFDSNDFNTVLSNILNSPIIYPDYLPENGKDLMKKLLQRDPNKRMCSGPSGSDEIQTHEFFNLVDWKKLMVKDVKPIYKPSENTSFGELKDAEEPQGNKQLENTSSLDSFNYYSQSITNLS